MSDTSFTKDALDIYLKELGKEFRRLNGKHMPAEIVMVGGAAVLVRYGFRGTTTDVDAYISASSAMEQAILIVRDKFDLPHGWINSDFKRTTSYSSKLSQYSEPYRTFSNILEVRVISGEYLVAMKLMAGREYKHDLSDIVGILAAHKSAGAPLTLEVIKRAAENLYDDWEKLPKSSRDFIEALCEKGDYDEQYAVIAQDESEAKNILLEFQVDYPNVTNSNNISDILASLKERKRKPKDTET